MSSVLHMLPLGAAWLEWDRDHGDVTHSERPGGRTSGQQQRPDTAVDVMARDHRHTILLGEDGTGKSSLAFQAAVTLATDDQHVTFVRPAALSRLPVPVHAMPSPQPAALQLLKFWYPEQTDEVVTWCANLHTQAVLPDVIIVDDFDVFVGQSKNAEHGAARLCAALLDAAAWIRQKSGDCRLLFTASHGISSLPSVFQQFHFNVVRLKGPSGEEDSGACDLTCETSSYNVRAHYSVSPHSIRLLTVVCKQNQ